jgi:Na+/proline symporter
MGTGLRPRKASRVTPVDFITDRYQSQILRYTIVFLLQVIPYLIYLAAQVMAIKVSRVLWVSARLWKKWYLAYAAIIVAGTFPQ